MQSIVGPRPHCKPLYMLRLIRHIPRTRRERIQDRLKGLQAELAMDMAQVDEMLERFQAATGK